MSFHDEEEMGGLDAEMARLARQQRMAKIQRKVIADQSDNEIRKQDVQLDKLRKDNVSLKEQLRIAQLDADAEKATGDYVRELRARYDGYEAEIVAEKERLAELNRELSAANNQLSKEMRELSKAQNQIRSQDSINRQISILENKVQHATKAYNTRLTKNAKLRAKIEDLKKERGVYDMLKRKLEAELQEQKRQMGDIVEQSNRAYEARDDARVRIAALQERAEKDTREATTELKELNRTLESERRLKEFMGVKGRDRAKELEAAAQARREKGAAKEKPEDVILQYEAVFEEIKQASGIEDTSQLVDKFIETEDRNFSLFNLVNELNSSIERLREQIQRVEREIAEYNSQGEKLDDDRKETLKKLESKLMAVEEEAVTLQEKSDTREGELKALVESISDMFKEIGCDQGPIAEMLGEKEVNERNVMQFLGMIEQRANDLLLMQAKLDYKAQKKWEADADRLMNEASAEEAVTFDPTTTLGSKPEPKGAFGTGPKIATAADLTRGVDKLTLTTTLESDSDEDDDDEEESLRPLTHEELRTKVIARHSQQLDKSVVTEA